MKSTFLGTIAALFLMISSCACTASVSDGDLADGFERAAWQMACEAKKIDCTRVDGPIVGYAPMPQTLLGFYPFGSPVVLITMKFYGKPESAIVATHEIIHFLQNANHENLFDHCAREEEAFNLTYEMVQKYHLLPKGSKLKVVRWNDAAGLYGCPSAP